MRLALGRVGEVDLQELGEEAPGRGQGEGDRRAVIAKLALAAKRRWGDRLVDPETTGVGEVDQQQGEVSGHGNDPVPDPEVERIERGDSRSPNASVTTYDSERGRGVPE